MSTTPKDAFTPSSLIPSLRLSVAADWARESDDLTPLPPSLQAPAPRLEGASSDEDAIITSAPRPRRRGAKQGDVIAGRYIVDGQIGRGGMGRVLKVRHQVLDKPFALKLIKAPIATNQRAREMFYREARVASSLAHDNICTVVDFGQDPLFGLFMVMELLEGRTLFHRIAEKGKLAPKAACDVMWQIADALYYIHQRDIIHGDIKSENILLTRPPGRQRVVKLLDFGLARARRPSAETGIEGTPEYLAPERIYGDPASARSDIYALGVMFYEVLVGERPFTGDVNAVFQAHLHTPLPRPSERLGEPLDARADEIIARATAKDPDQRHPDVAGFMYELRTLMGMLGMNVSRRRTTSVGQGTGRTQALSGDRRRHRRAADAFEHAPVPLAALDDSGVVKVANRAFLEFLGVASDAATIRLAESGLAAIYPELSADLAEASQTGCPVKRVLALRDIDGVAVDVMIVLQPTSEVPEVSERAVSVGVTGDGSDGGSIVIIMALHPLASQAPSAG